MKQIRLTPPTWIALILMIIGGLNWGLIGLFGVNIISAIFGGMSIISRIIYTLVGMATIYFFSLLAKKE